MPIKPGTGPSVSRQIIPIAGQCRFAEQLPIKCDIGPTIEFTLEICIHITHCGKNHYIASCTSHRIPYPLHTYHTHTHTHTHARARARARALARACAHSHARARTHTQAKGYTQSTHLQTSAEMLFKQMIMSSNIATTWLPRWLSG